ncbi:MAG: hypothetical protein P8011_00470 [Acidihalobacter sp.]|uniref:hypothetical protein n=1 Tax=Acidihalobacter sp. TaxID=1872108 RepID=UPI00307F8328
METKKSPPPMAVGQAGHDETSKADSTVRPRKIHRVLRALATGRSFNRFEAERALHDHCLHTTVASIQRDYGISVYREMETVAGYEGAPTRVCRYRLLSPERARAQALLATLNSKGA